MFGGFSKPVEALGEAWHELPIGDDASKLLAVFEQQFALCRVDVDAIKIVPGLIPVVDGNGEQMGVLEAQLLDARIDPSKRRQVACRAAVD